MSPPERKLFADDEYRTTWWQHKSDYLKRNRGYPLEEIGEYVLGGKIPVTWVPSPYPDQDRAVFRLHGQFFTLAMENCRDIPGYDHLITYFSSDDKEIDKYYTEHGGQ